MRVCIFSFSQTGNTEKVARAIREWMAHEVGHCDLLRLEDSDPAIAERHDLVGVGAPAFYFREPANVRDFLVGMPDFRAKPKPFFFFVTHGGTPGAVFSRIHGLAKARGLALLDFYQCLGYDSYPPFAGRIPPSGFSHPNDEDLDRARSFASGVLSKANGFLLNGTFVSPRIPGSAPSKVISSLFDRRGLRFMMRHGLLPRKRVLAERCTQCGLCVENCPEGIIRLTPFPVIDESHCIACYQCQRICPENVYDCDWRLVKLLTGEYLTELIGKIRYPDYKTRFSKH
ncbi:MAG: EFR1 family ferrodoxin [Candidatus Edwardsbacteria bacterium]|nr:EFR1 family ferrodoxin [Candidatus Edwardsbacteria bacterium]